MKNVQNFCCILFSLLICVSCKKETTLTKEQNVVSSSSAEEVRLTQARWKGIYTAYREYPPSRTIAGKYFIANGYARIYSDSIRIHPHNYYYTVFSLTVPESLQINGDNITLEVAVKNPSDASFYIPYHGRDAGLTLVGTTNTVSINNVVPDSIRPDAHNYASMRIGSNTVTNITQLQYLFEDWGTLDLQTFNNGLVAYRNNAYLAGLSYNGQPEVGILKELSIHFKGSGFIDWVKLFNSATGELIMSEDFNTDGQSTVVWYK